MDERRSLERPSLTFPPQVSRRQFLQFVVNQRNYSVQGLLIADMNTLQQFRDLHNRCHITARPTEGFRNFARLSGSRQLRIPRCFVPGADHVFRVGTGINVRLSVGAGLAAELEDAIAEALAAVMRYE